MVRKRDGRKISRDALEHLRKHAIRLWKKDKEVKEIANNFDVSEAAVYKWIVCYKKKGFSGLKQRKALGAKPKLSEHEVRQLVKMLEKTADHYGFETPLWDCKKITQLIKEKFGKKIHFSNVWRLLQRLGLTSQKPERQAIQRNEKEVKNWIEKIWPKILAHARRWQAIIYFQDESAVQLSAFLGRTWSKKGKTPIIKVTGNRGCIMITSAISNSGRMVFRLEKPKDRITSLHHIDFLKQVQKNHPSRKIIIIEDQAPVHTGKIVQKFIEENKKRFALYYLPTYSPDLNPDEHVWGYLKGFKLKAHQAKSIKEFKPLILSKMRSIQRQPKLINSLFYGKLFD